ncbi:hypothetical protein LDO32_17165 [Luteimonas sp. Y-2-2-4F]|nr:hypothetical protein [Luteimonas sp. Y-2-2-4F]MCD9033446.1 hypothetical protein [Luteimonas sp. Y-2-2-4F]
MSPSASALLPAALLSLALLLGGCRAPAPEPPAEATPAPAGPADAAATLPADAVRIDPVDALARFPALAEAAAAASARRREAFEAEAAAARARGEDVAGWRLRLAWRGLIGNRYLRVAEGEGEAVRGPGAAEPIVERYTYDGVSGRVLALADWFDDAAAWPAIAAAAREGLLAEAAARGTDDAAWRARIEAATAPGPAAFALYEPVFSADGPVMGFDLLFAPGEVAPESAGVQRVRIPLAAVEPYLAAAHRGSLYAMAGSE